MIRPLLRTGVFSSGNATAVNNPGTLDIQANSSFQNNFGIAATISNSGLIARDTHIRYG